MRGKQCLGSIAKDKNSQIKKVSNINEFQAYEKFIFAKEGVK